MKKHYIVLLLCSEKFLHSYITQQCTQLMNYLLINKQTAWYRTVQSIWRWMGLIPDKVLLFCIIKGEEQLWVISDIAYNSLYEGVNTVSCVKCNLFLRRFSSWLKIQSTKITLLFNIRKNIKKKSLLQSLWLPTDYNSLMFSSVPIITNTMNM